MPTNQQRRAAAKRKLQRQLERRAERARKRRQMTIIGAVAGAVLIGAGIGGVILLNGSGDDDTTDVAATTTTSEAPLPEAAVMPAGRKEALPPTVDCTYEATPDEPAAKAAALPATTGIGAAGDLFPMKLETSAGPVGLWLRIADSPCTVNSFVSLARQGYFTNTTCHRLTTSPGLKVLQCGDPSGSGSGGPGYKFGAEFPVDQYAPDSPEANTAMQYNRGVVAMANPNDPNSNGSQFFLVYGDSQLPPKYTVFGWIDENDLPTLDRVAEKGVEGGADDGAPVEKVEITAVTG